ncbi:hypothetical protein [Plantactinospora endophytica]|uniref:Uncharacterized protein n=1 Tax=Plantactinospora endophytica TaxID=673535 RepID=A0ABQ4DY59_9ACTN|nr:hypothetical protein [Plantactinospora endophytica]GIG87384.1 hypothetical protein Pen02_23200 [Plantactinospora endophytica]
MDAEDARVALDEVRSRDQQVRAELSRQRPGWRATLLTVGGYYLAMAGLDFPFPVPLLTLAVGAALLLAGHLAQTGRSAGGRVRYRRDAWRPGILLTTAGWVVGLAGTYALTRLLLQPVVPEGPTSVLGAIPSAVLMAAMARWLYGVAYGPPSDEPGPAGTPGTEPDRRNPPRTGDR